MRTSYTYPGSVEFVWGLAALIGCHDSVRPGASKPGVELTNCSWESKN